MPTMTNYLFWSVKYLCLFLGLIFNSLICCSRKKAPRSQPCLSLNTPAHSQPCHILRTPSHSQQCLTPKTPALNQKCLTLNTSSHSQRCLTLQTLALNQQKTPLWLQNCLRLKWWFYRWVSFWIPHMCTDLKTSFDSEPELQSISGKH